MFLQNAKPLCNDCGHVIKKKHVVLDYKTLRQFVSLNARGT